MAQLYTLLYGKSKKRMHPIMTDVMRSIKKYMDARKHSTTGWHEIVPAESGATAWRQKSATIGGNRCESVARIGHGPSGYISKRGFNPHT